MQVSAVQHAFGWYNDKRVVTEHVRINHKNGNATFHNERWFYPVHLYDSKARIVNINKVGNSINMKV